jgi:hypothetical protein
VVDGAGGAFAMRTDITFCPIVLGRGEMDERATAAVKPVSGERKFRARALREIRRGEQKAAHAWYVIRKNEDVVEVPNGHGSSLRLGVARKLIAAWTRINGLDSIRIIVKTNE